MFKEFLKKVAGRLLDYAQKLNNKLYEEEGLSDDVLENQISINTYRAKLDLPDKKETIYEDFVQ